VLAALAVAVLLTLVVTAYFALRDTPPPGADQPAAAVAQVSTGAAAGPPG
jgi:hypothetical protein